MRSWASKASNSDRSESVSRNYPTADPTVFPRVRKVQVFLPVFGGSLLHTRRRWQIWMRSLSVCSRGFDRAPGGADGLLIFFIGRHQRIERDVQRAFLYSDFAYAVQRFDRVGYFSLAGGISELLNFDPSGHGFGQSRIAVVGLFLHVFLKIFVRSPMSSCICDGIVTFTRRPDVPVQLQRITAVSNV